MHGGQAAAHQLPVRQFGKRGVFRGHEKAGTVGQNMPEQQMLLPFAIEFRPKLPQPGGVGERPLFHHPVNRRGKESLADGEDRKQRIRFHLPPPVRRGITRTEIGDQFAVFIDRQLTAALQTAFRRLIQQFLQLKNRCFFHKSTWYENFRYFAIQYANTE